MSNTPLARLQLDSRISLTQPNLGFNFNIRRIIKPAQQPQLGPASHHPLNILDPNQRRHPHHNQSLQLLQSLQLP